MNAGLQKISEKVGKLQGNGEDMKREVKMMGRRKLKTAAGAVKREI